MTYPAKTKEAGAVASYLLELCLTFGNPAYIRSDTRREFTAKVVSHVRRWLKLEIDNGQAHRPRGQGNVKRVEVWIHDVLSEICESRPERWDEYVIVACWIKRTMPDSALTSHLMPFYLPFRRKLCTQQDALVPQVNDCVEHGGLNNFIEK